MESIDWKCGQGLSGMACLCFVVSGCLAGNIGWLEVILWLGSYNVESLSLACLANTGCNLGTHLELCTEDQHIISSCGLGFLAAQMLAHSKWTRPWCGWVTFFILICTLKFKGGKHSPPLDGEVSISLCRKSIWNGRNCCGYFLKILSSTLSFLIT